MCNQRVGVQFFSRFLVCTEVTHAGAEIEEDRIEIVVAKNNARGVPAVSRGAFAGARR
jgi:hypothetical protein